MIIINIKHFHGIEIILYLYINIKINFSQEFFKYDIYA